MLQVNEHSYSMSQELKKLSISVLLEINEQRGRTPTFVCSGVRVFAKGLGWFGDGKKPMSLVCPRDRARTLGWSGWIPIQPFPIPSSSSSFSSISSLSPSVSISISIPVFASVSVPKIYICICIEI